MGTKREKRSYTPAQKAEILAALTANKGNLHRTALQVQVPRKTIERWVEGQASDAKCPEETAALRQAKRDALGVQFHDLAKRMLELLGTKLESMSGRDLAWAAAVATDKWALLTGDVASRSETISTSAADAERVRAFRERYARLRDVPASFTEEDIRRAELLVGEISPAEQPEQAPAPAPSESDNITTLLARYRDDATPDQHAVLDAVRPVRSSRTPAKVRTVGDLRPG
jgi:hypothetical protein